MINNAKQFKTAAYVFGAILVLNFLMFLTPLWYSFTGLLGHNAFSGFFNNYIAKIVPNLTINFNFFDPFFRYFIGRGSGYFSFQPFTILINTPLIIWALYGLYNLVKLKNTKGLIGIRFFLAVAVFKSLFVTLTYFFRLIASFSSGKSSFQNPYDRFGISENPLVCILVILASVLTLLGAFYFNNYLNKIVVNSKNKELEGTIFEKNDEGEMLFLTQEASKGKRVGNLVIDYIILLNSLMFIIGYVYDKSERSEIPSIFINVFINALMLLLYYPIQEAMLGYTCGKAITGTKVVDFNQYGSITWSQAFMRTLSRCVPFEIFSGFGAVPWHDMWTDTSVVHEQVKEGVNL